jgi:hypothetical protein
VSRLGLTAAHAYLDGHGPIDPQLAQLPAEDATWQVILIEMVDLATGLDLVANADGSVEADAAGDAGVDSEGNPDEHENVPDCTRQRRRGLQVFRSRGSRHRGGSLPPTPPSQW